ncbi:MAG: hypothetical protein JXR60_00510 [Bacteroidales bacterium]|nr:hypothetical protein [Bacteroidales bacterium]
MVLFSFQSFEKKEYNVYYKTKVKCSSGDCGNGKDLALVFHYYSVYNEPTPKIDQHFVLGFFKDKKLNGRASVTGPLKDTPLNDLSGKYVDKSLKN